MKFESEWHRVAQEMSDENDRLRRRLAAFEERRSPDEFPIDHEGWRYDGARYVTAPHHSPAYTGEKVVICEMNGPAEARERNANLICSARGALFWWRVEVDTAHQIGQGMEESEAKRARLQAQIQDMQLIFAHLPPDLLTGLEELLDSISFHFSPNKNTMRCVQKTREAIAQIKSTRINGKTTNE